MGKQVANNREQQEVMYLHQEGDKWYILSEPKSYGLIKSEYVPIGNKLVYPKKWGRKKAAEVLLRHLIDDNLRTKDTAETRLKLLSELWEDVKVWDE